MLGLESACTYGIRPGIRHRQDALSSVWEAEILIGKLLPINRLAASAVTAGEISSLAHAAIQVIVQNGDCFIGKSP